MKNTKGFTLVEVIISIAALAIISAVLLRLFVLAGDTNNKASSMQSAELCVTSTIETVICADTIYDALDALDIDYEDNIINEKYALASNGYDITIDLNEIDNDYPGTLYTLDVSANKDEEEFASISTKKYYKEQERD